MRVIYLAHPVAGAIADNVAQAKRWLAWASGIDGIAPIAPWIVPVELFAADEDGDAEMREFWLARDCAVVARCDELWLVGGRISQGMKREAAAAHRAGVVVTDLTGMGEEPPRRRA